MPSDGTQLDRINPDTLRPAAAVATVPDRCTPPATDGTRPVTIAAAYCDRPASSSVDPDTGHPEGGADDGRGAWGFCAVCGVVLGRRSHVFRQRYCGPKCRRAAERQRCRPCVICGAPVNARTNRTCSKACGAIFRQRQGHPPELGARILALLEAGKSQTEAGLVLGLSKSAVGGYLHRHHIPHPRPGPKPAADAPSPAPPAEKKPSRPVLIVQPDGADRRQPGRYCSAHAEIRWHPHGYYCRAAAA